MARVRVYVVDQDWWEGELRGKTYQTPELAMAAHPVPRDAAIGAAAISRERAGGWRLESTGDDPRVWWNGLDGEDGWWIREWVVDGTPI